MKSPFPLIPLPLQPPITLITNRQLKITRPKQSLPLITKTAPAELNRQPLKIRCTHNARHNISYACFFEYIKKLEELRLVDLVKKDGVHGRMSYVEMRGCL